MAFLGKNGHFSGPPPLLSSATDMTCCSLSLRAGSYYIIRQAVIIIERHELYKKDTKMWLLCRCVMHYIYAYLLSNGP